MTEVAGEEEVVFGLVKEGEVIAKPTPPPEKPYKTKPHPTLKQICSCESGNGKYGTPRQFYADGSLVIGLKTPKHLGKDVGMCQINTLYHLDRSIELGYDIYTEAGNWGYALYLYQTQGTQPWSASKPCWGA